MENCIRKMVTELKGPIKEFLWEKYKLVIITVGVLLTLPVIDTLWLAWQTVNK